jgi:hypothetical protein
MKKFNSFFCKDALTKKMDILIEAAKFVETVCHIL